MNIALIGAGRVGSVLGRILTENGERITAVVSRTLPSARAAGAFVRCKNVATSFEAIPRETTLLLIATPHSAVEDVARRLAALEHLRFARLSACHTSGMLTARALSPLAERGATVFSFHPLQTFPRDFAPKEILPTARHIFFGVDGGPRSLAKARQLARRLNGKAIVIPAEMRALYHAACVVASNHLTTLMWVLERMFDRVHSSERRFYPVFEPIIMATLRNVALTSPMEALSGPVARGGVETVEQHFDALRSALPDVVPYFCALTAETTRLAEKKGSITSDQAAALYALIAAHVSTS